MLKSNFQNESECGSTYVPDFPRKLQVIAEMRKAIRNIDQIGFLKSHWFKEIRGMHSGDLNQGKNTFDVNVERHFPVGFFPVNRELQFFWARAIVSMAIDYKTKGFSHWEIENEKIK